MRSNWSWNSQRALHHEPYGEHSRILLIISTILLLLPASHTSAPPGNPGSRYFWQVTDLHMDPQYKVLADPADRCVSGEGDSSYWGDYRCDLPFRTAYLGGLFMNSTVPQPNFVVWTGDSTPHWLDYSSVEQYTEEMVFDAIAAMTNLLTTSFPNSRVLPCLGNHDNFPSDQLAIPPKGSQWLARIAKLWSHWLPEDAQKSFAYGGYYSLVIEPGLLFVSINTVWCDVLNTNMLFTNNLDPAGQFEWLEETLTKAAESNQKVFLMGHRTPGADDGSTVIGHMFHHCGIRYAEIFNHYSSIIEGTFWGHEHVDSFRVYRDLATNTKPTVAMLLAPSLTTFTGINPSLRLFEYNSTHQLVNYYQYHANLTLTDVQIPPKFQLWYDAKSAFSMRDLSPASWWEVSQRLATDDDLWVQFTNILNTGRYEPCEGKCKMQRLCAIQNPDYDSFVACLSPT